VGLQGQEKSLMISYIHFDTMPACDGHPDTRQQ